MTEKPAPDAEPEFMGTSWEEDVPETHLDVVEEIAEALADMRRHVYPTPDKPDSSYAKWERANKALSALRTHDDTLEDAALVGEIEQPLRSALRFAASHSCITSAQEQAILSALRTHDDTLEDAAKIVLGLVVRGREPTRQEFAQAIRNMKAKP